MLLASVKSCDVMWKRKCMRKCMIPLIFLMVGMIPGPCATNIGGHNKAVSMEHGIQRLIATMRLRGGGGGGGRRRILGASRKGFMASIGLKRSADGMGVTYEDPFAEKHVPTREERDAAKAEEDKQTLLMVESYKEAGQVANEVLAYVTEQCQAGVKASDVCLRGDKYMLNLLRQRFPGMVSVDDAPKNEVFSFKEMGKLRKKLVPADLLPKGDSVGIGFPTNLGINNICGRFAPNRAESPQLNPGDMVQIDVSCHVRGFISSVAHTIIIPGVELHPNQMDVILAAKAGASVLFHSLRPGAKASDMLDHIEKAILSKGCHAVDGVLSRKIERFDGDGSVGALIAHRKEQVINDDQDIPPDCIIQEGDVWVIDMLVTNGDGHARMKDYKQTMILRRIRSNAWIHLLRLQASREFMNKVASKYPAMPFHMREFPTLEDRLGLGECVKQRLVLPYPVLYERKNNLVARTKFTVLVVQNGALPFTTPLDNVGQQLLNSISFIDIATSINATFLVYGGQRAPHQYDGDKSLRYRKPGKRIRVNDEDDGEGKEGDEQVDMVDEGEVKAERKSKRGLLEGKNGVDKLERLLHKIAKGGEEFMNKLLPHSRNTRKRKFKVVCPGQEGGAEKTVEFSAYIANMCSNFIDPATKGYKFLDGDRTNLSKDNIRWVAAIQMFEAAMLRSAVWVTDIGIPQDPDEKDT